MKILDLIDFIADVPNMLGNSNPFLMIFGVFLFIFFFIFCAAFAGMTFREIRQRFRDITCTVSVLSILFTGAVFLSFCGFYLVCAIASISCAILFSMPEQSCLRIGVLCSIVFCFGSPLCLILLLKITGDDKSRPITN